MDKSTVKKFFLSQIYYSIINFSVYSIQMLELRAVVSLLFHLVHALRLSEPHLS